MKITHEVYDSLSKWLHRAERKADTEFSYMIFLDSHSGLSQIEIQASRDKLVELRETVKQRKPLLKLAKILARRCG